MFYSPRSIIAIYAALFFSHAALTNAASADCFKLQGDGFTAPAESTMRVSPGVICPDTAKEPCTLSTGGFVNATSTLNITTGSNAKVFAAVGKATHQNWPESIYGSVGSENLTVSPGRIGWYGFTVSHLCFVGVLEDCAADINVPTGTVIETCRAGTLGDNNLQGIPFLSGTGNFIDSDRETVANMTTNPARETKPSRATKVGPGSGFLMAISMAIGLGACILS